MELGVTMFPTDLAMRPDALAREVEARGFGSLFFPEHTHIPTSRKTPYPAGEPIPEEYKRTLDPFVALTAAAAATERLRVGTGICLVNQHDPIVLAKEVASIDMISNGRFIFGVGYGWNVDEMEHHGVDPSRRWGALREKVLAMKALWQDEEAGYQGRFVSFSPSWSWPKPVQRPHPPIHIGGRLSPTTVRHVIELAAGWMPILVRSDVAEGIGTLRRAADEAGRDPASIEVSVYGVPGRPEALDRLEQAGVTRALFWLPPQPADSVLPLLDHYASLLTGVGP
jgi:probable F420-dependent oxidoreductase